MGRWLKVPYGRLRSTGEMSLQILGNRRLKAIQKTGGNKAEAAKLLGIGYKTLFNKINELGVEVSTKVE